MSTRPLKEASKAPRMARGILDRSVWSLSQIHAWFRARYYCRCTEIGHGAARPVRGDRGREPHVRPRRQGLRAPRSPLPSTMLDDVARVECQAPPPAMSRDWPSPTLPTSSDAIPNGRMSRPKNWSNRPARYRQDKATASSGRVAGGSALRRDFLASARRLATLAPWRHDEGVVPDAQSRPGGACNTSSSASAPGRRRRRPSPRRP